MRVRDGPRLHRAASARERGSPDYPAFRRVAECRRGGITGVARCLLARAVAIGRNLHGGGLVTGAMRLEAFRQSAPKSQEGMIDARFIRAAGSIC
ncbi:hypothetical protein KDH83_20395 [Achromobacter sp. Marseille-Q0513]|uniref:hypothetical protein n=1 Tax=Achromobacter sp. Marseille-Q0513 TaxID=2829161 RepID=UPI001B985C0A|nr:hypothetical protein [Achromobacter sp. Marseille-Q0513]MBR8655669.1 hypothetical protein [Achromobacter sp. Marseille-Q0513]